MSGRVFVVSEWLPKQKKGQEFWKQAKELMALTGKEKGCVRAHATRQIAHPGSPGQSKYTVVLLQEYVDLEAFEVHCKADYVVSFFRKYVDNTETAIVEEWTCRLFGEGG